MVPPFAGSPSVVYTATVNAAAPFNADLVNTATLTESQGGSVTASATLQIMGASATLAKQVSASTAPLSSTLSYTITALNAGSTGFAALSDLLPSGLQLITGTLGGGATYDAATNSVSWSGVLGAASYAKTTTTNPAAFVDISGFGTPTGLGDEDSEQITLPFSFSYYGRVYTRTAIVANGYLQMFQGTPPAKFVFPNNTALGGNLPNGIIAPFWADLDPTPAQVTPTVTPTIFYATVGSAPSRRFIAQWNATPLYGGTAPNTFEVILNEADGSIEFSYKRMSNLGAAATVGLESGDGQRFVQHSFGTNSLSNDLLLRFQPSHAEQRTLTFQAQIVADPQLCNTITNIARLQSGAVETLAQATTAVIQPLRAALTTSSPDTLGQTTALSATTCGGTAPLTYTWDFGDGSPAASGRDVFHQYTQAGTYSVMLMVQDASSAMVMVPGSVVITAAPTATATATAVPPTSTATVAPSATSTATTAATSTATALSTATTTATTATTATATAVSTATTTATTAATATRTALATATTTATTAATATRTATTAATTAATATRTTTMAAATATRTATTAAATATRTATTAATTAVPTMTGTAATATATRTTAPGQQAVFLPIVLR